MQTFRNRLRFTSTWAMLGLAMLSLPLLATGQTRYRVTGLSIVQACGINNSGQVVGIVPAEENKNIGVVACLWQNGTVTRLGYFGTDTDGKRNSFANAINDAGDIAGSSSVYDADHKFLGTAAVLWHNGTMTNLGNFGTDSNGLGFGEAWSINNSGQVVGWSRSTDAGHSSDTAFLYQNGTMTHLGNPGVESCGYAINDAGDVAGYAGVDATAETPGGRAAVVWHNGTVTNLGNLGTLHNGTSQYYYSDCIAFGLNSAGQAAGYSHYDNANDSNQTWASFLWQNGTMADLGNLDGGNNGDETCVAYAINNAGDTAGYFLVATDSIGFSKRPHAFVYRNGQMLDLNTLIPADAGWLLTEAKGINDKGQICGNGGTYDSNSDYGAFVLDPVTTGDFDGDGHADLVWQNPANGQTGLWRMNNQAYVGNLGANLPSPSKEWNVVGTPDFNADGKPGFLWQNSSTGDIGYWQMDKGQVQSAGLLASGVSTDWHIVSTVDLNADGKPDFVWWNSKTGQAAVWYMNGTTVQNTALLASGITGWTLAGAMPHTGDSTVTLLWRNGTSGDLAYWTLKNTALQASGLVASGVPQAWQVAGAVDMDGDNQPDILWQNSTTGEAAVWYMNGTTFQNGNTIAGTKGTTWKLIGSR